MTDREQVLWRRLRARPVGGVPCARQQPLGHDLVDCDGPAARRVMAVEGSPHQDPTPWRHEAQRETINRALAGQLEKKIDWNINVPNGIASGFYQAFLSVNGGLESSVRLSLCGWGDATCDGRFDVRDLQACANAVPQGARAPSELQQRCHLNGSPRPVTRADLEALAATISQQP